MSGFGTGSDLQRGVQVAIAVIQGLASGDLNAALAGASAPLLAIQIKKYFGEENIAANTIAHALLGAVVAQVQGNNALSGAAGLRPESYWLVSFIRRFKEKILLKNKNRPSVRFQHWPPGLLAGSSVIVAQVRLREDWLGKMRLRIIT